MEVCFKNKKIKKKAVDMKNCFKNKNFREKAVNVLQVMLIEISAIILLAVTLYLNQRFLYAISGVWIDVAEFLGLTR